MNKEKVDLYLSGGGVRALHFHLGALRALEDMTQSIRAMNGVSGGAIVAAYVACNWSEYLADPERTLQKLREWVRSGVRDQIVNRTLIRAFLANRTEHFIRLLDRLYDGKRLSELEVDAPILRVAATSLDRPGAVIFTSENGGELRLAGHSVRHANPLVALAVGASAAYPGLLPALDLTPRRLGDAERAFPPTWVTDGGVYDNTGLSAIDPSGDLCKTATRTIVVDAASAPMATENVRPRAMGVLATLNRCFDVVQRRVDVPGSRVDVEVVSLQDFSGSEGADFSGKYRRLVQEVATDLEPLGESAERAVEAAGRAAAIEQLGLEKEFEASFDAEAERQLASATVVRLATRRVRWTMLSAALAPILLLLIACPALAGSSAKRDPSHVRTSMERVARSHVKGDYHNTIDRAPERVTRGEPAELIHDLRRFDFRSWVARSATAPDSLVTLSRELTLRLGGGTECYDVGFETSTSMRICVDRLEVVGASSSDERSLPLGRCTIYRAERLGTNRTTYTVRIPLDEAPPLSRVRVSLRATFVNAFQGPSGRWCGMKIVDSPKYAGMSILWRDAVEPKLYARSLDDKSELPIENKYNVYLSSDHRFYYVSAENPEPGFTIAVRWSRG